MDVFGVHQQLIDDYRSFTTGVVDVRDPRIKQHVAEELARGEQWPEPWLSLNPMFASGGSIDELVGAGLLTRSAHGFSGPSATKATPAFAPSRCTGISAKRSKPQVAGRATCPPPGATRWT